MDASTQTESFHLLNRADVTIQAGGKESFFQRKRLRGPRTIQGTPQQLSAKKKHPKKKGMSISLAVTHLQPHGPSLGMSDQGTDKLDSSGLKEALRRARVTVRCTEVTHKIERTLQTRPKSRHAIIEDRMRALDTPRIITRRPRVRSIARVPPGSTLVSEIKRQAARKKEINELFGSDSEEELPLRLWKNLERSVTMVDVNNNR